MAAPGEVLRSFRESRGWSRRVFCGRLGRYGWTEDILRDLEEGSIIFTEDHLKELAEAGLFLHQRISWQQMILQAIDNQWNPEGPAVITERQPHEDKEIETVLITVVKPKSVKMIATFLIGFTGLMCLGNAVAYSSYLYLGASIPFLVPLFESRTYRGSMRHPVYLTVYLLITLSIWVVLFVFLKRFNLNVKPQRHNLDSLKKKQPDFAKYLIGNIFVLGLVTALTSVVVFFWPLFIGLASLSTGQLSQVDLYAIWLNIQLPLCLFFFVLISRQVHPLLANIQAVRIATEIQKGKPPSPVNLPQDQT